MTIINVRFYIFLPNATTTHMLTDFIENLNLNLAPPQFTHMNNYLAVFTFYGVIGWDIFDFCDII